MSVIRAEPAPDGEAAEDATKDASFALSDLIPAGIILASAIAIALLLRYLVERALKSRNEIIARLVARTLGGLAVVVGLVYALSSLGIRVGLLLGALGIGGFALAFALKDTLENFISGVILQVRQPFDYSDTVKVDEYSGTVTDINLRAVELTMFSGEKVIIPSKDVLQNPIENWTANPTRRIDIDVGVSYDVDIDEACRVITDALADVTGSLEDPGPDAVFAGFGGSAVDLKARVWYESNGPFFDVQRDAAARVKKALESAGIDMPFPTRVMLSGDDGAVDGGGADGEPSSRSRTSVESGTETPPDGPQISGDDGHADDGDEGADGEAHGE